MAAPAEALQSTVPLAASSAYTFPEDDPITTALSMNNGADTRLPSPVKVQSVAPGARSAAVKVPLYKKNPLVALKAGTGLAENVPSCLPVAASNCRFTFL